jgi:hypothetical protein
MVHRFFERRGFHEDRRCALMVIPNGIRHEVKLKTNGKKLGKKSHEILSLILGSEGKK